MKRIILPAALSALALTAAPVLATGAHSDSGAAHVQYLHGKTAPSDAATKTAEREVKSTRSAGKNIGGIAAARGYTYEPGAR